MSKAFQFAAFWALTLYALGAIGASVLGVYVTLAGSEERALINADTLTYAKIFIWYLLGPVFPILSIASWSGVIATVMAVFISQKIPRRLS